MDGLGCCVQVGDAEQLDQSAPLSFAIEQHEQSKNNYDETGGKGRDDRSEPASNKLIRGRRRVDDSNRHRFSPGGRFHDLAGFIELRRRSQP